MFDTGGLVGNAKDDPCYVFDFFKVSGVRGAHAPQPRFQVGHVSPVAKFIFGDHMCWHFDWICNSYNYILGQKLDLVSIASMLPRFSVTGTVLYVYSIGNLRFDRALRKHPHASIKVISLMRSPSQLRVATHEDAACTFTAARHKWVAGSLFSSIEKHRGPTACYK